MNRVSLLACGCALALGLSGCNCGPPVCVPSPAPLPASLLPPVAIDAPKVTLTLFIGIRSCNAPVKPTSLTTQVLDPENAVVASSATVTGGNNPFGFSLTFDSHGPGSYHATVTADENSTQQYDITVLADGSKRPFADISGCASTTSVQRTSKGGYVCGKLLARGDGGSSALPFAGSQASGEAVWSFDERAVSPALYRLTDDGSSLDGGIASAVRTPHGGSQILASETELVVIDLASSQINLYRPSSSDDGGVGSINDMTNVSDTLFVARGGSIAHVGAQLTVAPAGTSLDAGLTQVCPVDLDQRAESSCEVLRGFPIGVDPGGLWLFEDGLLRFYAAKPDAGTLSLLRTAQSPWQLKDWVVDKRRLTPWLGSSPRVPFTTTSKFVVVPVLGDSGIFFEAYPEPSGDAGRIELGAADGVVWTRSVRSDGGTTTRVYTR